MRRFLILGAMLLGMAVRLSGQTATVTPSAPGISATGGTITFTVNMSYSGTLSALGLAVGTVPPGWSFGAVAGANPPQVANTPGDTGRFDFAYTAIPASPVSFSFTAAYAAGLGGNQAFGGIVGIFRLTTGSLQQITVPTIVLTSPLAGARPIITSAPSASGTVGVSFSYVIAASNNPTSFNASPLPSGLSLNSATGVITGVPTAIGAQSVQVFASNGAGSATLTLVITIGSATPIVAAPIISTAPAGRSVAEGATITLNVVATGTGLTYQWRKNGASISGAVSSTFTLGNVKSGDAGTYSVVVSNAGGAVTSTGAVVTVIPVVAAPVITLQPVPQSVASGSPASFTVASSGTSPLSYQWRKDGAAISGATNATLNLLNVLTSQAGNYSVQVTNTAGTTTSNIAALTVGARAIAGAYFGTLADNGGTFSLLVRSDGTGVLLGHARSSRIAFVSRNLLVDLGRHFRVVATLATGSALSTIPGPVALDNEYILDGAISADGVVTGFASGINLTFLAPAASAAGVSSPMAGFYQAGASGSSASSYTIVGAAGDCYMVTVNSGVADVGKGSVDVAGHLDIATENAARIVGSIDGPSSTISITVTPPSAAPMTFLGANNEARLETEKLVNISTRGQVGPASNALIAGFVISGDQAKTVLVRAIGPTLATFGVGGALSAARLEIYRGSTSVAIGNDWGASANASTVESTAVRVGAFPLAFNSRDAALVLSLQPGAYTATVTGQDGASGVSLVEVYDATVGVIPRAHQLINISTRAISGPGANTLTAGFAITGSVPKRVLIRGVGPSLAQFGIAGFLARPQLSLLSGSTLLAQNSGWNTSADASAIVAASAQVGAFALLATNPDAALIINLLPGSYTAQVAGVDNGTGTALVELYELP